MKTTKNFTPGPWDKALGFGNVLKDSVMYPIPRCEEQRDGETWAQWQNRIRIQQNDFKAEAAANLALQTHSPQLLELAERVLELPNGVMIPGLDEIQNDARLLVAAITQGDVIA